MKVRFLLCFAIFSTLFACKQTKHSDYQQKILGDWKIAAISFKDIDSGKYWLKQPFSRYIHINGFSFFKNGLCEDKVGYFSPTSYNYLGMETHYKLTDDSLSIVDLSNNKEQGFRIDDLTNDSLFIEDKKQRLVFAKQRYKIASLSYDQIVVSNGAWSTVRNVMIFQNGDVLGCANSLYPTGYYKSQVTPNVFEIIQKDFAKADIAHLESKYSANGASDGEEVSMTFIKHGKIEKSITDYEKASPYELIWAYKPVLFLYQKLKLGTLRNTNPQFNQLFLNFHYLNKICKINASESFYLWSLLINAKASGKSFDRKFDLNFIDTEKISKIQTDGQYYEVTAKNGTKKTYDIGFNFIERNSDILKFELKPKGY